MISTVKYKHLYILPPLNMMAIALIIYVIKICYPGIPAFNICFNIFAIAVNILCIISVLRGINKTKRLNKRIEQYNKSQTTAEPAA